MKKLHPAYIFLGAQSRWSPGIEPSAGGMTRAVRALEGSGAKVVYLEDVPRPLNNADVPDCLATHTSNALTCAASTEEAGLASPAADGRATPCAPGRCAPRRPDRVVLHDAICPVVIDKMIVYADDSHISGDLRALADTPAIRTALRARGS